jgi:single-strand DNA-binding protein
VSNVSINRVNISGNLTRDPELRATSTGTQVLTFGVAVNDRRRNPQTGEWEDVPNFVDCVVFGNRADPLSRFLSKGSKVAIEGKLRWRQWEKDGQKRSKLEVTANEVDIMTSRGGNGGGYQGNGGYQGQGNGGYQSQGNGGGYQQGNQGSYAASAPQQYSQPAAQAPAPQAPVPNPPDAGVYDEDIPF